MEGTMEQFTEKLAGLVELGKKNKNFLEYAQIDSYFKDMKLNSDMMEAIYDYCLLYTSPSPRDRG